MKYRLEFRYIGILTFFNKSSWILKNQKYLARKATMSVKTISINAVDNMFEYSNVKAILKDLKIYESSNSEVKKALKMLGIEDSEISNLSLTASMDYNSEIRFYLNNRVNRAFNALSNEIRSMNEEIYITIFSAMNLNKNDLLFLESLGEIAKVKVTLQYQHGDAKSYNLNDTESNIIAALLNSDPSEDDINFLKLKAQNYIVCGNGYDALTILNHIIQFDNSASNWHELGFANNMVGNDFESEFCFNQVIKFGSLEERAYADYSLAMLYARHHKGISLSLDQAEGYLLDGLECLKCLKSLDSETMRQKILFTENGLALILFRKNELDKAITIESNGINELSTPSNERALLQKSVMMYNLAQLYVKKDESQKAIDIYNQLLTLDPNFPEYIMEMAKVYIKVNDIEKAEELLMRAVKLENSIAEAHSLLGFVGLMKNDLNLALSEYRKAYELNSNDPQNLYDYLYTLEELSMYSKSEKVIEDVESRLEKILYEANSDTFENLILAIAESLVNNDNAEKAVEYLEFGLLCQPNNVNLVDNKELILNAE